MCRFSDFFRQGCPPARNPGKIRIPEEKVSFFKVFSVRGVPGLAILVKADSTKVNPDSKKVNPDSTGPKGAGDVRFA